MRHWVLGIGDWGLGRFLPSTNPFIRSQQQGGSEYGNQYIQHKETLD